MNNMNFKIPFYGKKGTIKDIKEDNKYYVVYRYGLSSGEENIFYVPKNDNNLSLLMDNYNNDLKGYLDINADKYETYKKSRLNKNINMKSVNALLSVSGAMILLSIPLFNTHESIGFFGVVLDTVAVPIAIYTVGAIIKKKNDDKKGKYINNYNKIYNKYKINTKNKYLNNKKTEYKGLVNDNTKKPVVDLNKVKTLKQEKNVA